MTRLARSHERLLVVRALIVALLAPALLRLPLPTLERLLEPRRAPHVAPPDEQERWAFIVDRLIGHGRPFIRPGCLTRGVTLFYVLRRRGHDVKLTFGIGEVLGRIEGHCWLTRGGEPILERADPREHFVETYSLPRVADAGA